MKKFNWGWGIALLYSAFVVLMLSLVWKTTTVKDDLVTPDYYAKELKFQDQLDKQKRTNELKEKLAWQVNGKQIEIKFPSTQAQEKVDAEIFFYNTAEAKKDLKVSCQADSLGACLVSTQKLAHGIYKMQIEWSAAGLEYYNEGTINIE